MTTYHITPGKIHKIAFCGVKGDSMDYLTSMTEDFLPYSTYHESMSSEPSLWRWNVGDRWCPYCVGHEDLWALELQYSL